METEQNIELFRELVRCGSEMFTWCYDANGKLLSCNCPEKALFSTAFSVFGCKDKMIQQGRAQDSPSILGTSLGVMWGVAFEKHNGTLLHCHVMGPAFLSDVSMRQMELGFAAYRGLELSVAWKKHFIEALHLIPTSPNIVFTRYLLMLHYCLTGQHLLASDIAFPEAPATSTPEPQHRDRHKVWSSEQALLQMVRNGDLNYAQALNNSILISNGVPAHGADPLRQSKISVIVFCSIVCRAAVEGGLSPEQAYLLGDSYIQSCESAKTMDELRVIPHAMYDDFIHRVHKCRINPALSAPVQKCIDYIEMHLEERIRAADLAALVGYSEYYITHKFREETHYFINDYIKFAKIERAKVLLTSTDASTQEIADRLGLGTRSYFSRSFRRVAGISPAEYRQKHGIR